MKKWLGTLTTLAITAAPVAAVVSCGSTHELPAPKGLFFHVVNDSKDIDDGVVYTIEHYLNDYIDEYAEAFAVKDIHIFDGTNSPFGIDEGDYVPVSNEITISTYKMGQYINFDDSDKANYIMQLLAHEYNHLVDHSYLLNIDPSDTKDVDDSIYTGTDTRVVQPWPKLFVDNFKSILHYDADTPKYSSGDIDPANPGAKSLGSLYDAKSIFDQANGQKNPLDLFTGLATTDGTYYVAAPKSPTVYVDKSRELKKEYLAYPYSMDELFARKMQIATTKYHGSTSFHSNGFYDYQKQGMVHKVPWESPYLEDIVKYQRGLTDDSNDGQYLADKPTQALADLYDEARGVGQTISFLENKNNKMIQSDGSFKGDIDRTEIRFGGTIKDGDQIGYMNGSDFAPVHITIQHSEEGKTFYLTDFVKASDIEGKELYISSNGTTTKITTTRDVKYGLVSTRRAGDTNEENYAFSAKGILQTL